MKARNLFTLLGAAGCLLAACSVDTSDINWVKDKDFDPGNLGGIANIGGVLNKGGDKGKAGSDGGEEGGEGNTGGTDSAGSASGGKPSGGAAGTPAGGVSNVGGGGAGTAGMGGMPPANGYPCKARIKPPALIADFTGVTDPMQTWSTPGKELTFGLYAFPPDAGAPMLKPMADALTAESRVDRPNGFGVWLTPCADASAAGFTTLVFRISGYRTDGAELVLRVGVGINDNRIANPQYEEGGCVPPNGQDAGYCRAPATEIKLPLNGPAGGTVMEVPFTSMRMGSPASNVDPTQITSVEWGFIFLQQEPAYNATVTVDEVSFK